MISENNTINSLAAEEAIISQPVVTLTKDEQSLLLGLQEAGAYFGRKHSIINPKMLPYLSSQQRSIDIIDLAKTAQAITQAVAFLRDLHGKGKRVIVIGAMPAAWEAVEKMAKNFGWFYVGKRWLGGTLTNFKTIGKRLERFEELLALKASEERWKKYSASDRSRMQRQLRKMENELTGLRKMSELPGALFIVDPTVKNHHTALREAKILKIPVIALLSSNGNPDEVDLVIPANCRSKKSIDYVFDKITELIKA